MSVKTGGHDAKISRPPPTRLKSNDSATRQSQRSATTSKALRFNTAHLADDDLCGTAAKARRSAAGRPSTFYNCSRHLLPMSPRNCGDRLGGAIIDFQWSMASLRRGEARGPSRSSSFSRSTARSGGTSCVSQAFRPSSRTPHGITLARPIAIITWTGKTRKKNHFCARQDP